MEKELNFEVFIQNMDLASKANELQELTIKFKRHNDKRNIQVTGALADLSKALQNMTVLFNEKSSSVSSYEKQQGLSRFIKSHQQLLKIQAAFSEKDDESKSILSKAAATLSAFYPLFLISEVFDAHNKQSK